MLSTPRATACITTGERATGANDVSNAAINSPPTDNNA